MNYHGASNDRPFSAQRNKTFLDVKLGHSIFPGDNVAKISGMSFSFIVSGSAMFCLVRVVMRSGRSATIGVVTKLMDVEAMLASGQSRNFSGHCHGSISGLLIEMDNSLTLSLFRTQTALTADIFSSRAKT